MFFPVNVDEAMELLVDVACSDNTPFPSAFLNISHGSLKVEAANIDEIHTMFGYIRVSFLIIPLKVHCDIVLSNTPSALCQYLHT